MLDELLEALHKKRVFVKFEKQNGDWRLMTCTRNPRLVHTAKVKFPIDNSDIVTVWDFEKDNYRTFKRNSVVAWAALGLNS